VSDDAILSEQEQKMMKAATLMIYQQRWGKPGPQEYAVIIKTIDAMGTLMAEAGRLDA
jgi:hypothetical protein